MNPYNFLAILLTVLVTRSARLGSITTYRWLFPPHSARLIFTIIWGIGCAVACCIAKGETLGLSTGKATPPGTRPVVKRVDLGTWDDVHASRDLDFMILRRGGDLFAFSPTTSPRLKKLTAAPQLVSSKIVAAMKCEGRMWLFCVPAGAAPFAFDVGSRKIADFRIPGLNIVPQGQAELQSWVLAPHAGVE